MVLIPIFSIMEHIEQNTAMGIKLMMIVVILRNRSLSASKKLLTIWEYCPIAPAAMPHMIARKMSWSMLDSTNGWTKSEGTMSTIMSFIETFMVWEVIDSAASAAMSAGIAPPGLNR